MTSHELARILLEMPDITIVCEASEPYEPFPTLEMYSFDHSYWSEEMKLKSIPKNTEFIKL